jgi:hypothetical protein
VYEEREVREEGKMRRGKGRGGAKKGHEFFGNQYTKIAKYARSRKGKATLKRAARTTAGIGITAIGGRMIGRSIGDIIMNRPYAGAARAGAGLAVALGGYAVARGGRKKKKRGRRR